MKHLLNRCLWGAGLVLLVLTTIQINAQNQSLFYMGVDLSYVNEMEDCGAVYRENSEARDPFTLFSEHGATLVRARLWHNPDWTHYSTLDDVKKTFKRAQAVGMATLLDIHYSDNWADPSRQEIPAAWETITDDEQLADAVYQYTLDVLMQLHDVGLTPTFVQVGNETNSGMLKHVIELEWSRDAKLFKAGIQAVRDFSTKTSTNPQIILHIAQPENTGWWFTEAAQVGITDFDVIGISYYPQWSTFSIADMGAQVSYLRQHFGKQVMVVETAYPWTRESANDTADNVLDQGIRGYTFSPEGQYQFMTDLTQSLINNGGSGVVYWEPAWVSTQCFTRWGQGSHWENATFFDFQNDNEVIAGIDFLNHPYVYPSKLVDAVIDADYGSAWVEDEVGDNLDEIAAYDLTGLYITHDQDFISLGVTVAGNVYTERGNYLVYLDTTNDAQGADQDVARRPITVADPFKPEYRLDVTIHEERNTINGSFQLSGWVANKWEQMTFTGATAIDAGIPSTIEIQFPRSFLGNAQDVNIAVVTTDQARNHTAGDILGTSLTPADWSAELILDVFTRYTLSE